MKTNSLEDDLKRDVWCLMGLPVDAVTMADTVTHMTTAIRQKSKVFLTTPNLNFVIACQSDDHFRNSVIQSDLVIADGMPLIWVAKLMGIPITERVSGSNLIEQMFHQKHLARKHRVFYFGGQDNVAQIAEQKTEQIAPSAQGVGSISPGFGSIEDMSKPALIQAINRAQPDILIVALGAKKGQDWIMHNLDQLDVPVISHLGAVVNFVAGTIKRSPVWMQKTGLEWMWRIKEEKALYKRYWNDGVAFLGMLARRALPCVLAGKQNCTDALRFELNGTTLAVYGGLLHPHIPGQLGHLAHVLALQNAPALERIEFAGCTAIDARGIGLLMMLKKHAPRIKLVNVNPSLARIFYWNGGEFLL